MKNLIKYHYAKAKSIGIKNSPTKELIDLGFQEILINDLYLPDFIMYETSNKLDKLPSYIEVIIPQVNGERKAAAAY